LPTRRSMCTFAFGACTGVRMTSKLAVAKQGIEGARELRVAIVDQEPHLPGALIETHQQIARLLQHPRVPGSVVSAKYSTRRLPMERKRARKDCAARPCQRQRSRRRRSTRHALAGSRATIASRAAAQATRQHERGCCALGCRDSDAQLAQFTDDPQ